MQGFCHAVLLGTPTDHIVIVELETMGALSTGEAE